MNINRNNYETIFLLYVDNELSIAEKKAVELFVQENPDLGNELVLLLETTLPTELISFGFKNSLIKNEAEQNALQENLLLHLDGELNPEAAGKLESAIATDASLKKEWKSLQQAKLDANDQIIFEDKQSLYRREKDNVIAIRFWRIAAAAAILFACLFTGIKLLKKDSPADKTEFVKNIPIPGAEKKANTHIASVKDSTGSGEKTSPENIASLVNAQQTQQKETSNIIPEAPRKAGTAKVKQQSNNNYLLVKEEKAISPNTALENFNKEERNKLIASAVLNRNSGSVEKNKITGETAIVTMKEKITAPTAPIIDYNSEMASPDSYATTAAFNETSSDNKILYMNEESVSRSKIGGLFRKVKRVIERNANIKTGNGVRIAGFEIAVK